MDIQFIAGFAIVAPEPAESRKLYVDALGLPLEAADGEYLSSEKVAGSRHFGVWPLSQAAQACFGTPEWPSDRPVPHRRARGAGLRAAPPRPDRALGADGGQDPLS